MPIGYLISTGLIAAVTWAAVLRRRPQRSSPIRLSYLFGFPLNWPLAVLLLLGASTALAIAQTGVHSFGFWIGLGLTVLGSAGLVVLRRRALGTGAALERALDDGLGPRWLDGADDELAARLRRRPSLARVLFAPISSRLHGVERIANIRYGPAGRAHTLDLYRDRSESSHRPTLIYLHPGAFRFGSKRLGARHLLRRLAGHGWVCVSANYRLLPARFPDPLVDVKNVIAWVREHGPEYGADPATVFLAGSSAGGHLAALAAFTPNDPAFQPGFEDVDTSVAGAITLYGYYGPVDSGEQPSSPLAYVSSKTPPCFVLHGDQDTLVLVEDARRFAEQLRAESPNPVVYAELPGAQHGFDVFRSRRFDTVVDAVEIFAGCVRAPVASSSAGRASTPATGAAPASGRA